MNICFVSVFMNYFDNPGGSIPTWLVNWAAKVSACLLYFKFHFAARCTNHASIKHLQFYIKEKKTFNVF